MSLLPPSNNINNSKIYFSKYELTKILNCYSLGVSKGDWKDYAINFNKNEAIFLIYKHSWGNPDCILIKLKENQKKRIIYKLFIKNKNDSKYNNIDSMLAILKRKNFSLI